jgi:thymidylate synthase (FAD)
MHRVEPNVYLIGESQLQRPRSNGISRSLRIRERTGSTTTSGRQRPEQPFGSELITEIMGRLCTVLRARLNKNVTKIREGNGEYIGNILKQKHGSVIEHGSTNWIIRDVSRVFTHELVRHRAGVAVSQESLRYVRMDDFGLWIPRDPELTPDLVERCEEHFRMCEAFCSYLSERLGLDDPGRNFAFKKKWTSFIRRFAPQGMATSIGITINFRALRHVLEMRTAEGAEVEIRLVFDAIAVVAKERWPAFMQDFDKNEKGEWVPRHSKV